MKIVFTLESACCYVTNNHFISYVKNIDEPCSWRCFNDGQSIFNVPVTEIRGVPVLMFYRFENFELVQEISNMSALNKIWTREEFNSAQTLIHSSSKVDLDQPISTFYSGHLKVRNIRKLKKSFWVDDEVINGYMMLLDKYDSHLCRVDPSRKKTLFMSTYFTQHLLGPSGERYDYPRVKRWTKSRGKDINLF